MHLTITDTDSSPGTDILSFIRLHMLYALMPGIFSLVWFFGLGVLFNLGIALLTALGVEILWQFMRGKRLRSLLGDYDSLLYATLLGIAIPSIAPWWISALGTWFALMVKHLLVSSKRCPINPAMASYIVLLLLFPNIMSHWLAPQAINATVLTATNFMSTFLAGKLPVLAKYDGLTSATPLQTLASSMTQEHNINLALTNPIFGSIGGTGWEWVALSFLCSGLWLVYRDIINWSIPAGILSGFSLLALLAHAMDETYFAGVSMHLFTGAIMFGAFFIAPDPSTSPQNLREGMLFGLIIGISLFVIRSTGIYPDGMAFAIILSNLAAKPWLTQRKTAKIP